MVLYPTLRQRVQQAVAVGDVKTVEKLCAALTSSSLGSSSETQAELLVTCAQAALQLGDAKSSQACLDELQNGIRLAGASKSCAIFIGAEMHFLQGKILGFNARGCMGAELVTRVTAALDEVQQGVKLAQASSRCAHLVYNGSVHFWHIARPLMRPGGWQHLQPHLAALLPQVQALAGHEAWKARIAAAMAACLGATGKLEEATKQLDAAIAMTPKAATMLQQQLAGMRTHFATLTGKGGKPDPKESVITAAHVAAQQVLSAKLAPDAAGAVLAEASKRLLADKSALPADDVALAAARLGWVAGVCGQSERAAELAELAAGSALARPRMWADLTKLHLAYRLDRPCDGLSNADVRRGQEALAALVPLVRGFAHASDVDGVHAACQCIWNAALPFLQRNLLDRAVPALGAAANALKAIDSPLHELRAQLHFELAKADAANDMLANAHNHALAATGLDYEPAQPNDAAHFGLARPLDRHLQPLLRSLELRLDCCETSGSAEDEALLCIESARSSKSAGARRDALAQAVQCLKRVPLVQPPAEAGSDEEYRERLQGARRLTLLWSAVVRVAWAQRLHVLVHEAAPYALAFRWDAGVDRDMVLLQVTCSYYEAEAAVLALRERGLHFELPTDFSSLPGKVADEKGVRSPPQTAEDLQALVQGSIQRGMAWASTCKQDWAVVNGAIYAWNATLPALRADRPGAIKTLLVPVLERLLQLSAGCNRKSLLHSVAQAALAACEHCVLTRISTWETEHQKRPEISTLRQARAQVNSLDAVSVHMDSQQELRAATALADQALQQLADMPCLALLEQNTRVQRLLGVSDAGMALQPMHRAIAQVTSLVTELLDKGASVSFKQATDKVQEAIVLLKAQTSAEIELWAKLSRVAFARGLCSQALVCAAAALDLLPNGCRLDAVSSLADMPEAELVYARVMRQRVEPHAQQLGTQLQLRQLALQHSLRATRLASLVAAPALLESAAGCAWDACSGLVTLESARAAFVPAVHDVCKVLLASGAKLGPNAAHLAALVCACFVAAGSYQQAIGWSAQALHMGTAAAHKQLWFWRARAIALLAGPDAQRMPTGMHKLGGYCSSTQAEVWLALAQSSSSAAIRHEALAQALHAAECSAATGARIHLVASELRLRNATTTKQRTAVQQQLSALAHKLSACEGSPRQRVGVSALLLHTACLQAVAAVQQAEELEALRAAGRYAAAALGDVLSRVSDATCTTGSQLPQTPQGWAGFDFTALVQQLAALGGAEAASPADTSADRSCQLASFAALRLQARGEPLHSIPLLCLQAAWLAPRFGQVATSALLLTLSHTLSGVGAEDAAAACFAGAGEAGFLPQAQLHHLQQGTLVHAAAQGLTANMQEQPATPAEDLFDALDAQSKRKSVSVDVAELQSALNSSAVGSALSLETLAASVAKQAADSPNLCCDAHAIAPPLAMHHFLLRSGRALCSLGHWAAGAQHLHACQQAAAAFDDAPLLAECRVALANCAVREGSLDTAQTLVESAAALGGTAQFWQRCLLTYSSVRSRCPGGAEDAVSMLMLGERMLQAKLDKAAGAGLRLQHAMRALRLQRCEQQLQLISKAQANDSDVSDLRAALQSLAQSSRASADHETFVTATLCEHRVQSVLQMRSTHSDPRPHLSTQLAALTVAVAASAALLESAVPPGLPPHVKLPSQTAHASLLVAYAEAAANFVVADADLAHDDMRLQRPAFPVIGDADASAVVRYLDITSAGAQQELRATAAATVSRADAALLRAQEAVALLSGDGCAVQRARCRLIEARVRTTQWRRSTLGTSADTWQTPGDAPDVRVTTADAESNEGLQQLPHGSQMPSTPLSAGGEAFAATPALCSLPDADACIARCLRDDAIDAANGAAHEAAHAHDWAAAAAAAELLIELYGAQRAADTARAMAMLLATQSASRLVAHASEAHAGPDAKSRRLATRGYCTASAHVATIAETMASDDAISSWFQRLPAHVRVISATLDSQQRYVYLACHLSVGSDEGDACHVRTTVQRAVLDAASVSQLQQLLANEVVQRNESAGPGAMLVSGEHSGDDAMADSSQPAADGNSVLQHLDKLLEPFALVLRAAAAPVQRAGSADAAGKGKSAKGKASEVGPAQAAVVLCLDKALSDLPFEAATCLQQAGCITRDLHLLALSERAAAAGDGAKASLTGATYLHTADLAADFSSHVLNQIGETWTGSELRSAMELGAAQQLQLLQRARTLVLATHEPAALHVPPEVLATANLERMQLAWIAQNSRAAACGSGAVLRATGLANAYALGACLLAGGAGCCVVWSDMCDSAAGLPGLVSASAAAEAGQSVAEAVRALGIAVIAEGAQRQQKRTVVVFGLPHLGLAATTSGKVGKKK